MTFTGSFPCGSRQRRVFAPVGGASSASRGKSPTESGQCDGRGKVGQGAAGGPARAFAGTGADTGGAAGLAGRAGFHRGGPHGFAGQGVLSLNTRYTT